MTESAQTPLPPSNNLSSPSAADSPVRHPIPWRVFLRLVAAGAMSGFVYAAFMHFLPRYLNDAGLRPAHWSPESFRNALAAAVLLCAAFGQAYAGRLCRPGRLERLLVIVLFGNVPPLIWMAVADGPARFVAACLLAFIHFMNQPIYNSLIAQLIPLERRSLGYGFSNMMCFGVGAFGPAFAGLMATDARVYGGLAVVAAMAGGMSLTLLNDTGHVSH